MNNKKISLFLFLFSGISFFEGIFNTHFITYLFSLGVIFFIIGIYFNRKKEKEVEEWEKEQE